MLIGSKNWCSSCASGLRSKRLWWRPLAVLIVVLAMSDRALSAGWLETNPNNNQYPSNNNQFQSLLDSASTNSNSGGGNGYYLNKPVFTYVGCFNDRRELRDVGDKDYTFITKFNKSLPTVELCVLLCAQDGYSIAGIQAFDECYCGNNYGRYNATDDTNCFFQCAGKYTCGGYNANSVYLISVKQTLNKDIDRSIAAVAPPKVALNTHLSAHQSSAANINNPLNNPCLSSPCLNSGMCITLMDDKGVPRGYICRCTNPQDSGAFCEDRNFCFSNPCLNGGSCANKLNGYSCKCTSHWTGFNCNIPANVIVPPPQLQLQPQAQPPLMMMPSLTTLNCFDHSKRCLNGGTCAKFPNELDYSCKCPHNYGGTQCEIFDVCAKRPCQHEGVCTFKPPQYYECKCTDSYYGANCERPNPCKNGTGKCANGAKCQIDFKNLGDYFCACEGNFVGKHCDQCKPQFTGKYCDRCVDGFTGPHCDLLINRCLPSPCANGICVMDGSSYKCICTEGWKGKNCTEKNCLLKPCSNEGVCTAIYDNSTNQVEYKCLCPNGFYGEQCQLKDSNPCMSNPCKPSEDCIQSTESPASFYCVQSMNICERIRPCNENSECIYSRENNTFYCRCLNGAAGCDSVYLSPTGPAGVGETTAPVATSTPVAGNSAQPFESTLVVPKILAGVGGSSQGAAAGEVLNNAQSASGVAGSSRPKPEIPKFGFNYDNLYLILPVALVILVVVFFSSIVIYFGFKARSRTAKFNKKESNIRNIHYINENMTFDDNLKPIPSGSNSSIGFSNSDKEYNEGYGRV